MEDTTLWDKVNRITAIGTGQMMYSNRRAQQTGFRRKIKNSKINRNDPQLF